MSWGIQKSAGRGVAQHCNYVLLHWPGLLNTLLLSASFTVPSRTLWPREPHNSERWQATYRQKSVLLNNAHRTGLQPLLSSAPLARHQPGVPPLRGVSQIGDEDEAACTGGVPGGALAPALLRLTSESNSLL
ncbi:hypothetical protein GWK47_032761 [Chionoecetes opilio]|uniref:Uncharacterized protein n=1 Tax=Chionoecetes opilio TaxID=41210 RepID=A0A8J4YYS6_CHIOP|nr:hypothetical protein GWK47_032761 [Chionoecetes opilio]